MTSNESVDKQPLSDNGGAFDPNVADEIAQEQDMTTGHEQEREPGGLSASESSGKESLIVPGHVLDEQADVPEGGLSSARDGEEVEQDDEPSEPSDEKMGPGTLVDEQDDVPQLEPLSGSGEGGEDFEQDDEPSEPSDEKMGPGTLVDEQDDVPQPEPLLGTGDGDGGGGGEDFEQGDKPSEPSGETPPVPRHPLYLPAAVVILIVGTITVWLWQTGKLSGPIEQPPPKPDPGGVVLPRLFSPGEFNPASPEHRDRMTKILKLATSSSDQLGNHVPKKEYRKLKSWADDMIKDEEIKRDQEWYWGIRWLQELELPSKPDSSARIQSSKPVQGIRTEPRVFEPITDLIRIPAQWAMLIPLVVSAQPAVSSVAAESNTSTSDELQAWAKVFDNPEGGMRMRVERGLYLVKAHREAEEYEQALAYCLRALVLAEGSQDTMVRSWCKDLQVQLVSIAGELKAVPPPPSLPKQLTNLDVSQYRELRDNLKRRGDLLRPSPAFTAKQKQEFDQAKERIDAGIEAVDAILSKFPEDAATVELSMDRVSELVRHVQMTQLWQNGAESIVRVSAQTDAAGPRTETELLPIDKKPLEELLIVRDEFVNADKETKKRNRQSIAELRRRALHDELKRDELIQVVDWIDTIYETAKVQNYDLEPLQDIHVLTQTFTAPVSRTTSFRRPARSNHHRDTFAAQEVSHSIRSPQAGFAVPHKFSFVIPAVVGFQSSEDPLAPPRQIIDAHRPDWDRLARLYVGKAPLAAYQLAGLCKVYGENQRAIDFCREGKKWATKADTFDELHLRETELRLDVVNQSFQSLQTRFEALSQRAVLSSPTLDELFLRMQSRLEHLAGQVADQQNQKLQLDSFQKQFNDLKSQFSGKQLAPDELVQVGHRVRDWNDGIRQLEAKQFVVASASAGAPEQYMTDTMQAILDAAEKKLEPSTDATDTDAIQSQKNELLGLVKRVRNGLAQQPLTPEQMAELYTFVQDVFVGLVNLERTPQSQSGPNQPLVTLEQLRQFLAQRKFPDRLPALEPKGAQDVGQSEEERSEENESWQRLQTDVGFLADRAAMDNEITAEETPTIHAKIQEVLYGTLELERRSQLANLRMRLGDDPCFVPTWVVSRSDLDSMVRRLQQDFASRAEKLKRPLQKTEAELAGLEQRIRAREIDQADQSKTVQATSEKLSAIENTQQTLQATVEQNQTTLVARVERNKNSLEADIAASQTRSDEQLEDLRATLQGCIVTALSEPRSLPPEQYKTLAKDVRHGAIEDLAAMGFTVPDLPSLPTVTRLPTDANEHPPLDLPTPLDRIGTAGKDNPERARLQYTDGFHAYFSKDKNASAVAVRHFVNACNSAPQSALYRYYLALSLYRQERYADALDQAKTGAQLEAGSRNEWVDLQLERVQGRMRAWLEDVRRSG